VSDEEPSKRANDQSAIEREIDRRASENQQQYKRVHVRKLIPAELVYAFVVLLLLGLCIALWTVRTVSKDAGERYYNEPLWNFRAAQPHAQLDFVQEEESHRQAVATAQKKGVDEYAKALADLGRFYLLNGRWDQAAEEMQTAHKAASSGHRDKALMESIDFALGDADLQMGRSEEAQQWLQKSNTLLDQAGMPDDAARTKILEDLVTAYSDTNNLQAARTACVRLLQQISDPHSHSTANPTLWRCQLADICRRTQDYAGAEQMFREALPQLVKTGGSTSSDVARARFGLALTCARNGQSQEANKNFALAMSAAEQSEGPRSALLRAIKHAYAYNLWKSNWIAAAAMTFSATDQESKTK